MGELDGTWRVGDDRRRIVWKLADGLQEAGGYCELIHDLGWG
jgi:hypothetical protein